MPYRDPRLDAEDRIAEDIECCGCGYGLRGQMPEDECPICGVSIGETLARGTPAGRRLERNVDRVFLGSVLLTGLLLVAQFAMLVAAWANLAIW